MAEAPPSSSQDTFYEEHQISLGKENVSSPSRPQSSSGTLLSTRKERRNPTVTPKRFNKFFAPRSSQSTRGGRQSKARRQLQDITRNAVNQRRSGLAARDEFAADADININSSRPTKRRKFSTDLQSSPPQLQSSPLKHVQTVESIPILEDEQLSEAETLPGIFDQLRPSPKPIRRLRTPGPSRRMLESSFGGYDALLRGRRGPDHAADSRAETAKFVTTPMDTHAFRGTALPFCTATCNTNPLIAIGDEEGSVRLIDSSVSSQFSKTHVRFRVHRNAVMDLGFSSDDYVLATASGDQTARVVDMQTQQTMCVLTGHKSSVKQVRFKPSDDNMVTTSARDGTVQIWDLRCGGKSAVQNFRASACQRVDADGMAEPQVRYSQQELEVGYGHRSQQRPFESGLRHELSITSFQYMPDGREHLIVTASEVDASVKLWDLRNAGRRNPVPLSSTSLPGSHHGSRHYGINAMAMSGDGARLYTICRDSTVYVYSTNQLALGYVPEMSAAPSRRRTLKEPKDGLAPLYGFRNTSLRLGTFYVKASLRPAKDDRGEILAVGSTDRCPVLFPTDERYLPQLRGEKTSWDQEDEDEDIGLPTLPPISSQQLATFNTDTFDHGTALVRAHNKEVTSLAWTTEGNLISVSDDFTARCWREDAQKARELRQGGEAGGGRWRSGWAEVGADWDEDDC
ncbi:related to WD40 repeat-containing L2DTL [Lecanosticta acicola]|uniref:Related to WD40 repeat-containing L2DTL n=1 Tax=Lecanosticta acicola TaxID=111012 RepID=A0AAI9E9X2_9PEZI|nr:related to WD40 repeat-containing L2DTL [Lecanosticta acicola]